MSRIGIACVQLEAMGLDRAEEALERALDRVEEAARSHPDLILLPECTYPAYYLGSIEDYRRAQLRSTEEVLHLFAEKARRARAYVAVGLARLAASGRPRNSIALIDPAGEVVGIYDKIFLWHFDRHWFDPGGDLPVFDLPFGRVGLMVCADGRMPEIPRALALQGARLILDATAWVTAVGAPKERNNPQVVYMLPARAMENGVWIAAANKVGVEADSVVYCGRSLVIAPDGRAVAMGSTDREEIVLAEIDLSAAPGPRVHPPLEDPWLGAPTDALPVAHWLRTPIAPEELYLRLGVLQLRPREHLADGLERIAALGRTLVQQGASFLIVSTLQGETAPSAEGAWEALGSLSARLGCALLVPTLEKGRDGASRIVVTLFDAGRSVGVHRPWGGKIPSPYTVRGVTLGVMVEEEGWAPEVARSLMLQGGEALCWFISSCSPSLHTIARARADENRVFVTLAAPPEAPTAIFDPLGQPLAIGVPGQEQGLLVSLFRPLARHKEMAPGSHVVFSRPPTVFGRIGASGGQRG